MLGRIKPYFAAITLVFIVGTNLAFGLTRITNFSAVDEHLWTYGRVSKFWNSVKYQYWSRTNINDKPGVTTAIISGIGLLSIDPMEYDHLLEEKKTDQQLTAMNAVNFYLRLPIYLFTLLMAPVFYLLLKKTTNKTIALLSTAIIYTSPILLGVSLIINPDSLLWLFVPLSILSFVSYLQKPKLGAALIAGVFFGLSLLTKYTSALLYVFLLALIFIHYIYGNKENWSKYFKSALKAYWIAIAVSFIVVAALYPAVWDNVKVLLNTTFLSRPFQPIWHVFFSFVALLTFEAYFFKGKITEKVLKPLIKYKKQIAYVVVGFFLITTIFVFINTFTGMRLVDSEMLIAKPKPSSVPLLDPIRLFGHISTGFYVLFFSINPLILISVLISLLFALKKISKGEVLGSSSISLSLLAFILFYYLGSAVNDISATVRYQISIYPLAAIIAAIGIKDTLEYYGDKKKHLLFTAAATAIMLIGSLALVKPYYFAYSSFLLPEKYIINVTGMGDGSYEAAKYLNSLPDAKNISIWSDKIAVCQLFIGDCSTSLKPKNIDKVAIDYFVVSRGRATKSDNFLNSRRPEIAKIIDFDKLYSPEDNTGYIIKVGNNKNNYVKVVKFDDAKKNK